MGIALPDGWTYGDLRDFIQSELQEDRPGRTTMADISEMDYVYYSLRDFDSEQVIFTTDWDTIYSINANLIETDGGKDMEWVGDPIEVAKKTTYVPVAEMSLTDFPRVSHFSTFPLGPVDTHAHFSDAEAGFVIRRGVVFEPGNYADKQFSATADQLRESAARFKPVENRVNHVTGSDLTPSYFDGKMGRLISLEFDDTKNALLGTVEVPEWFDSFHQAHYPGEPLRNSLEIDRVTYDVVGNVLVPNPRVSASALMSAHAQFADSGSSIVQREHVMGKAAVTAPAPTAPVEEPKTVSVADFARVQAEAAADRARLATMAAERRSEKAAAFAENLIRSGKMVPAMRVYLTNLHEQASRDDEAQGGTVKFTKEDKTEFAGTRVGALEAAFADMPDSMLTRELIDGEHAILPLQRAAVADFAKKDAEAAAEEARKAAQAQKDAQERNGR